MKEVSQKELEERLKSDSQKITEKDLEKVVEKQKEIEKKFSSSGPLGRFVEDVKLLLSIVRDYYHGEYKEIPWYSIAAIVAALLYVLNPFDLIPDVIPFVGQVDDAAVVAICLRLVEADLQKYKEWKLRQEC